MGYDFRFGHDREGSMRTLTELGPAPRLRRHDRARGDRRRARRQLDAHPRAARARARRRGRACCSGARTRCADAWSRATAAGARSASRPSNLGPENEVLPGRRRLRGPPARARRAGRGRERLPAVINVGRRPTLKVDDPVLAEAHVIDWSGDLYGQRVELAFLHHLREERRFADLEALRAPDRPDRDAARGGWPRDERVDRPPRSRPKRSLLRRLLSPRSWSSLRRHRGGPLVRAARPRLPRSRVTRSRAPTCSRSSRSPCLRTSRTSGCARCAGATWSTR